MQVSVIVKEAIDEAGLYAHLDYKPDVAAQFTTEPEAERFEATLDASFFNVFNQASTQSRYRADGVTVEVRSANSTPGRRASRNAQLRPPPLPPAFQAAVRVLPAQALRGDA